MLTRPLILSTDAASWAFSVRNDFNPSKISLSTASLVEDMMEERSLTNVSMNWVTGSDQSDSIVFDTSV
jgi:hypothetical protein